MLTVCFRSQGTDRCQQPSAVAINVAIQTGKSQNGSSLGKDQRCHTYIYKTKEIHSLKNAWFKFPPIL